MKIIDRKALLALPAGTMFSKYVPCVLGEVRLKGATVHGGAHFWYQNVADAAMCGNTTQFFESLDGACDYSVYVHLDVENVRCEGDQEDTQRFALWEVPDVRNLVTRLIAAAPMDSKPAGHVAPAGGQATTARSAADRRLVRGTARNHRAAAAWAR